MRRIPIASVLVVVAFCLTTAAALAAINVKTYPTASFSGASVTLTSGNFSGLGNTAAFAVLTVSGQATYTCHNNGNPDNVVPGQNPVPAQNGSTSPQNLGNADHNGRGNYAGGSASVSDPGATAKDVGCGGQGSNNWTAVLDTLTATSANLTISEGSTVVFCRNYTLGGPAIGTAC